MRFFSRHLRLLFLLTALIVAAFSTGLTFLFFLVYLSVAILPAPGSTRATACAVSAPTTAC